MLIKIKKKSSVNQSPITPYIRNNPSWHCQTCNCKDVCCEEQSAGNDTQSIHFGLQDPLQFVFKGCWVFDNSYQDENFQGYTNDVSIMEEMGMR